jgi:carbon monoxide dehydrogenase subunit G
MPDLLAPVPDAPVSVTLGGRPVTVDVSLRGDLAAALVEWQAEVELGPLLAQYPPDAPN